VDQDPTLRNDVYAFVFNPRKLMAEIGLQGSKIKNAGEVGTREESWPAG